MSWAGWKRHGRDLSALSKEDKHDWPVGQAKIDGVEDFGFALIERVERLQRELADLSIKYKAQEILYDNNQKLLTEQQAELESLRQALKECVQSMAACTTVSFGCLDAARERLKADVTTASQKITEFHANQNNKT